MRPMILALALLLPTSMVACTSSTPKPRDPSTINEATPGDAPDFMNFAVQPLPDQNRDAWPDVVPVIVYLFNTQSAQPKGFAGGFEFRILDLDQKLIQRWVIGPADTPRALGVRAGLTGYSFRLDFPLSQTQEKFPDRVFAEARFSPLGGAPIISRTVIIPFRLH